MKTEALKCGMTFQSNVTYVADEAVIDVYMKDTFFCDNTEALSSSITMGDSCQVGFLLENLQNTVLDFQNAKVVFHGRIVPFVLINCENVTIKNLRIDYDRPFYTQADVLAVEEGRMEIRIAEGFDYEIRNGYLYARSETWEKKLNEFDCLLWLYDKTHQKHYKCMLGLFGEEIQPRKNPPMTVHQLSIEERGDRQVITGFIPEGWDYNNGSNVLLITHEVRDKNTITLVGGRDITVENCVIIHGASMGIVGMHTHNITVDRFCMYFDYEGNGRMVTNNADAIHTFNCSGKIEIKNCHMEGLLDDTVNIHNNYMLVKSAKEGELTVYSKAFGLHIRCKCFCEGDRVCVYRGRTQEPITTLEITDVEIDAENLVHRFRVRGDLSGIATDDTVENLSAQPEIYIHDCVFGEFRGTMRLQSRSKTVVENCSFANKDIALLFTGDTTYWFESGPVNEMEIRGCRFRGAGKLPVIDVKGRVEFTDLERFYHRNISVRGCRFEHGTYIAKLRHVSGFMFEENECEAGSYIETVECEKILSEIEVRNGTAD